VRCPYCKAEDTRVIDSRDVNNGESVRRRRECGECQHRFTTYERVEAPALIVVKRDGRREEFSPEKLRQKLRVALTKRPIGEDVLDSIIRRVESEMRALSKKEVSSQVIGERVLSELKALDHVAYIRFASVYRQFADIDELRREVEGLSGPGVVADALKDASKG
jgi:transcriptional repressor NrdR